MMKYDDAPLSWHRLLLTQHLFSTSPFPTNWFVEAAISLSLLHSIGAVNPFSTLLVDPD